MKKYNLFLDDIRYPRDVTYVDIPARPYIIVRNYRQFCNYITEKGVPQHVSFDHDLGDEHYDSNIDPKNYVEKTGYDCAKWLVNYCSTNNVPLPTYTCHSMNPIGKKNILSLLDSYNQFHKK